MSQEGKADTSQQVPAVSRTSAPHSPKFQGHLELSENNKQVLKVSARGFKEEGLAFREHGAGQIFHISLGTCLNSASPAPFNGPWIVLSEHIFRINIKKNTRQKSKPHHSTQALQGWAFCLAFL